MGKTTSDHHHFSKFLVNIMLCNSFSRICFLLNIFSTENNIFAKLRSKKILDIFSESVQGQEASSYVTHLHGNVVVHLHIHVKI